MLYTLNLYNAVAAAKSLQSCPTLCDSIGGSLPGSPVPGTLQARILDWVAISFSNAWKWKGKVNSLSHVRLLAIPWAAALQAPPSMGFSRQEYWSGVPLPSPKLIQCAVSKSCPALCHPIDSSLPGSSVHGILQARILEWVAMPSSGGSSRLRNQTHFSGISYTAGRFFTHWATWEARTYTMLHVNCMSIRLGKKFFEKGMRLESALRSQTGRSCDLGPETTITRHPWWALYKQKSGGADWQRERKEPKPTS